MSTEPTPSDDPLVWVYDSKDKEQKLVRLSSLPPETQEAIRVEKGLTYKDLSD